MTHLDRTGNSTEVTTPVSLEDSGGVVKSLDDLDERELVNLGVCLGRFLLCGEPGGYVCGDDPDAF